MYRELPSEAVFNYICRRDIFSLFMDFKSSKISPWLTLFAFITLYSPFIFINALFDNTKKTETFSSWYSVFFVRCVSCGLWRYEVNHWKKVGYLDFPSIIPLYIIRGWIHIFALKGVGVTAEGRKLKIISPHQHFKPHKTRNPGVNSCMLNILPGNTIANREWRGEQYVL